MVHKGSAKQRGAPEEREELMARAWEFRKAGMSVREIGRELGVSHNTAHRYITKRLQEYMSETRATVAEVVTLELQRLDQLTQSLWEKAALGGDTRAVDSLLKIMERRSKYLGLDVQQTSKTVSISVTPDELAGMSDDELTNLITTLERA
jgi:AcrR family transcriptional regulator